MTGNPHSNVKCGWGDGALSLAFAKELRCSTEEGGKKEKESDGGGDVCFDVLSKT